MFSRIINFKRGTIAYILSMVVCSAVYSTLITNGMSVNGVTYNQPWYSVLNTAGNNTLFLIDTDGDMYVDADTVAVGATITGPFTNSLLIQDPAADVFVVNASIAYINGKVYTNQSSLPAANGDDLVIQNSAGTPVAILRSDDNSLYLAGQATHEDITTPIRKGLDFDGTDDYVDLPDVSVDWSGGLTIEAWVNWDALQNYARLINFGNGEQNRNIALRQQSTTTNFGYSVHNGSTPGTWANTDCTELITIGKWTHIAVTHDSAGVVSIYKNGTLCVTEAGVTLPTTINRTLNYIGRSSVAADAYFDGQIDEVRVWQGVRSQAEVSANMFKTYATLTSSDSLIAYWDMDHILGSQVVDSKGSYHGTLYGETNSDSWISTYTEQTLTVSTSGTGTVSPSGATTVAQTQQYPIVATPNSRYEFNTWTTGGTATVGSAGSATTYAELGAGAGSVTASYSAIVNNILTFDGSADYITLPSVDLDFSGGFTIEFWVNYTSRGTYERIIEWGQGSADDNFYLSIDGVSSDNYYLRCYQGASGVSSVTATGILAGVNGQWTHIAMSMTAGGTVTYYKNGEVWSNVSGNPSSIPNTVSRASNFIGYSNWSDPKLHGSLDEFRVWTEARTAAQIKDNMFIPALGNETNLLLYYPFNDADVSTTLTEKVSAANGTLVGMAGTEWDTTFIFNTITLADGGANGTISNEGSDSVAVTQRYNVYAQPASGYVSTWSKTSGSGTVTFEDATLDSSWIELSGGDATITANFSVWAADTVLINDHNDATNYLTETSPANNAMSVTNFDNVNHEGGVQLYLYVYETSATPQVGIAEMNCSSLAAMTNLVYNIKMTQGTVSQVTIGVYDGSWHDIALGDHGTPTASFADIVVPLTAFDAVISNITKIRMSMTGQAGSTTSQITINNIEANNNHSGADVTAPTVPVSLSTSGQTDTGFNFTWGASTDAGSGVAGYVVYKNASTLVDTVTSGTSLWIARTNAYYALSVKAYDAMGNTSAQSRQLYHFETEARSGSFDINFTYGNYAGDLDDDSGTNPDWIDWYSVTMSGGTYRLRMRKSSNDATYAHSINLEFANVAATSISRQEDDGGWTNWVIRDDDNTFGAPTGSYKVTALFYGINWNVDWLELIPE